MPSPRRKVLIADDELSIVQTLAIIFESAGFLTTVANDGQAAVELAKSWKPDLFISDVIMPSMDGFDAALQIVRTIPACRVLLFTARPYEPDYVQRRMGRHSFMLLEKPAHPTEVIATARRLLES
jgi:two-component system, OmpR family, response regulator